MFYGSFAEGLAETRQLSYDRIARDAVTYLLRNLSRGQSPLFQSNNFRTEIIGPIHHVRTSRRSGWRTQGTGEDDVAERACSGARGRCVRSIDCE